MFTGNLTPLVGTGKARSDEFKKPSILLDLGTREEKRPDCVFGTKERQGIEKLTITCSADG